MDKYIKFYWLKGNKVRAKGSFDKRSFPFLLKRLVNSQSGSIQRNLESGFRTTGIFPLYRQKPLSRLLSPILDVSESNVFVNETLKDFSERMEGLVMSRNDLEGKN